MKFTYISMKSILKKGTIGFFIVLSVYLICNIVRIRNSRQYFIIPHTNIEFTFYGDYIILGEKYTSILPPKSNYLKIKKYNNLFCKFVFLSDTAFVFYYSGFPSIQVESHLTDFEMVHIFPYSFDSNLENKYFLSANNPEIDFHVDRMRYYPRYIEKTDSSLIFIFNFEVRTDTCIIKATNQQIEKPKPWNNYIFTDYILLNE